MSVTAVKAGVYVRTARFAKVLLALSPSWTGGVATSRQIDCLRRALLDARSAISRGSHDEAFALLAEPRLFVKFYSEAMGPQNLFDDIVDTFNVSLSGIETSIIDKKIKHIDAIVSHPDGLVDDEYLLILTLYSELAIWRELLEFSDSERDNLERIRTMMIAFAADHEHRKMLLDARKRAMRNNPIYVDCISGILQE